jgi:site-specific recombinase XerD
MLRELFERFMEKYQAERNPARNTVLSVQSTIPRFLSFCREKGREDINQITREDVLDFLNNSLNGKRTSSKKLAKALVTMFMNGCFKYGLLREKLPEIDFKGTPDVPRAPLKGFTAEEMALMRQNVKRLELRERILFNLLSNRPLRIQELVNLKVEDIDLEAKTLMITRSKNTKTRVLSLPKEALNDLREYIKPDSPREEALFGTSLRGLGFTVKEIIRKLRVNPNGRGSHGFRHYVIMSMLRDGGIDPAVVATIAGNTPETIYQNYSKQVSFDEQRMAEKTFDRLKNLSAPR